MTAPLKIETFDVDYVANPNPSGATPDDEFWSVREQILDATQKHGKVAPEDDAHPPQFYLVDSQYNDDLYQQMELYDASALTEQWISDICEVLSRNRGWAVALSVGHFSILIFANRLLVPSDKYHDLSSLAAVLKSTGDQLSWNSE
ncbi:hypothetical protein SH501x_002754 [Pirellulaceae bacterium SH501]